MMRGQVDISIPWTENQHVMDLVEAVMNLVAAEPIIRPWSFQGINILRSLHEAKYFAHMVWTKRLCARRL